MSTLIKKPVHVHLRPDQLEQLRTLAERRNVSMAELVREGVDLVLLDEQSASDSLWDIVALVEHGPGDLSDRHDKYQAAQTSQT